MERYGTRIVASPGGRSVGGCKSILDGGYSGPSSHISLDMNLCLRSTCLPAGRLLFPSLLLPRLLRPSSCRLPLHALSRHTTSQQRHPSSSLALSHHPPIFLLSLPSTAARLSLSLSLVLSQLFPLLAESAPPLHRGRTRLFSFFGIPIPLLFLREDSLQWREFTREYIECLHRRSPSVYPSFVKSFARLTEIGRGEIILSEGCAIFDLLRRYTELF